MAIDNNPLILAYDVIDTVLKNNLTDINTERSSKSKPFIFPSEPEKIDKWFPIITIKMNNISFQEAGAGRWFETTYDEDDKATSDIYGNWGIISCEIIVFVKRGQKFHITLLNKSQSYEIKNK